MSNTAAPLVTDQRVLQLARKHCDVGLAFDRSAHITRCTDAELIALARAIIAEHEASKMTAAGRAVDTVSTAGSAA